MLRHCKRRGCRFNLNRFCCCIDDKGGVSCPGHLIFKKKCLFVTIVTFIVFSALVSISSMYYLSIVETEWIMGQCYVSHVEWKSNLYDVYISTNDTSRSFYTTIKNDTISNTTNTNETFPIVILQVKGWSYNVKVKYKNMFFKSVIRDPSETEAIPPLYEEGNVYDCLCMVEKLRSEITFQQDTYEKYIAYLKKKQEQDNDDGKSLSDYVYDSDDIDDDIFFVIATTWPKIDAFSENHETEKRIKIMLVTISILMLLISVIMLKVFYSYYVKEEGDAEYTEVHRF